MTALGNRLRELRKDRRLTQKQLEERSRVPQNTISRIEIGLIRDISTKVLVQLAQALGVTTDEFLGLTPQEARPARPRRRRPTKVATS